MSKKHKIELSIVDETNAIDGYETSEAIIQFKGDDINEVIINTLRRVILSLIPIYGFDNKDINITTNTSIFDNGEMRCRLANLPIYIGQSMVKEITKLLELPKNTQNIINDETSLEDALKLEYNANIGSAEINIVEDSLKEKDISDNLTMSIHVINKSDDVMNVSTANSGVVFYYKKIQIPHIYDRPLALIQLRKNEEFICNMTSSLNIGLYHATYQGCAKCYHNKIDDNTYNLILSSKRQLNERDLLIRACKIIIKKVQTTFDIIKANINDRNKKNSTLISKNISVDFDPNKIDKQTNLEQIDNEYLYNGELLIEGDQHTMGNLLSYFMKIQNGVKCGYTIGHPNISKFTLKYSCKDKEDDLTSETSETSDKDLAMETSNILVVIDNACNKIVDIYTEILNNIDKLGNFGYTY